MSASWFGRSYSITSVESASALPGWIVKTTANTSLGIAKTQARVIPTDPVTLAQRKDATRASRTAADAHEPPSVLPRKEDLTFLRKGLDELPSEQRELLILLMADPPLTYQQISKKLVRPIGSIGPTRARILDRLRKTTAVRGITLADDKDSLTALAGRNNRFHSTESNRERANIETLIPSGVLASSFYV